MINKVNENNGISDSVNNLLEKERYYSIEEIISMIDEPNRTSCEKIYLENKDIFDKAK
jgi:hypothetical protein